MSLLLTLLALPFALTSCGGDDDEPDDNTYYDFSVVWDVVDKGDYSTAAAQAIAASFTIEDEDMFEAFTTAAAVEAFKEYCERLRYGFSGEVDREITLKARLVRNEGNQTIASKTFHITPNGTTLNAPAMNPVTVTVE